MHHGNRLLAALPGTVQRKLARALEPVTLTAGEVLVESGMPVAHVYFPLDCVVSLLTVADGRIALEVALVGCESMVGVTVALGLGDSPVRALVQGPGEALRMKAEPFRRAFDESPALHRAVHLCAVSLLDQVTRTAACNRFHVVESRLARSLLMTRDRLASSSFHLTHEFLAQLLGVRRAGITTAAHSLKSRGLIEYSRGQISIVDGRGLEAASCSCYERPAGRRR
ncbi:MAG TPA: Crp/Fnr family transcriptional regulator [Usitatibacter sp.]|nr:Crp/Fnr family transcriptional regulator [Usitatibacter sp.]